MSQVRRIGRGVVGTMVLAAALVPLMAARADAATTDTSYSFVSAPGDYIGQGVSSSYAAPTATFNIIGTAGYLRFYVTTSNESWSVDLAAPLGSQLHPGPYASVQRAAFRDAGHPGLDASGDGRGCGQVFGSFFINSIGANSSGQVVELDATFTQNCESAGAPALNGVIKYNAPPAAGIVLTTSNLSSVPGQPITLAASVAAGAGGLPTGSVSFFDGSTLLVTRRLDKNGLSLLTIPNLKPGAHVLHASYSGDAHHAPATSSDVTQQVLAGSATFWFSSAAGDFIGGGATASYVAPTLYISGNASGFQIGTGSPDSWTGFFAAPVGQTLQPHTTYGAQRFNQNGYARVDFAGNGRGCNQSFSTLTIKAISVDGGGNLKRLEASFVQRCESNFAQPLTGTISFKA